MTICDHNDLICYIKDPLLMGNDQDRSVDLFTHLFKYLDQTVEAPQVDACLRLIK